MKTGSWYPLVINIYVGDSSLKYLSSPPAEPWNILARLHLCSELSILIIRHLRLHLLPLRKYPLTHFYSLITLLLKYNISLYLHFAKYQLFIAFSPHAWRPVAWSAGDEQVLIRRSSGNHCTTFIRNLKL